MFVVCLCPLLSVPTDCNAKDGAVCSLEKAWRAAGEQLTCVTWLDGRALEWHSDGGGGQLKARWAKKMGELSHLGWRLLESMAITSTL